MRPLARKQLLRSCNPSKWCMASSQIMKSWAPHAFCWTTGFNKDDCSVVVSWSAPLVVLVPWQKGHGFGSSSGLFCVQDAWTPFDCAKFFQGTPALKVSVGLFCKSELPVHVNIGIHWCLCFQVDVEWTPGCNSINCACSNHTAQLRPHRSGQSNKCSNEGRGSTVRQCFLWNFPRTGTIWVSPNRIKHSGLCQKNLQPWLHFGFTLGSLCFGCDGSENIQYLWQYQICG